MQIVNRTNFHVVPLPGRLSYPKHSLTIIVKGTFDLKPASRAEIAPEQLPPGGDEFEPDDTEQRGSPRYDLDLVHFKPHADLLLVGRCHAPGGRPTPKCQVTFGVGSRTRSLVVIGDRHWEFAKSRVSISQPKPFSSMDLRYENSFGGEGFGANPVGKGYVRDGKAPAGTKVPLPNIEDPRTPITSPASHPEPAGFGPLSRTWAVRASGIGTYGEVWFRQRCPWFPEDLDWSSSAAPPQMRLEGYARGDEELYFENLHAAHTQYRCRLPGIRMRSFLNVMDGAAGGGPAPAAGGSPGERQPSAGEFREVPLNLDTIWVDAGAEKLVLVWRGTAEVSSDEYEEVEHLLVTAERLEEQAASLEQCRALLLETLAAEEAALEPPDDEPEEPEEAAAAGAGPAPEPGEDIEAELDAKHDEEMAKLRATLVATGIDPDNPPPLTEEVKQEVARLEKEHGIEDDPEEPEEAGPGAPARLTREQVQERLAQGEDLAGEDMTGLDLSGLGFKGVDLSEATLTNAILKGADLSESDLSGANLTGADLEGANLSEADLSGATLSAAHMKNARLQETTLSEADLTGADLSHAAMEGAVFEAAVLQNCSLEQVNATDASFTGANLTGANLKQSTLESADLSQCALTGANLQGARLPGATLDGVSGAGADLSGTDLTGAQACDGADFSRGMFRGMIGPGSNWGTAILDGADLRYTNLEGADFSKASMEGANLEAANLKLAILRKANLKGARLVQSNLFQSLLAYADLSGADLSGSNLYGADLADAVTQGMRTEGANLKKTKLAPG